MASGSGLENKQSALVFSGGVPRWERGRRAPEDAGLLFSQAKWGCQHGRMETGGQGHLGG